MMGMETGAGIISVLVQTDKTDKLAGWLAG